MGSARVSGRMIYFFGALGGVLFGYDTGVISGALLFIPNDFKLTPFLQGAIVAGLLLGAMIGAAFAGRLSDRLGRRRLIIIAAVVFTGGALLAAFAPTVWVLIAARVHHRPRRRLGRAGGAALLVRDRAHRDARGSYFAQPADGRVRHPGSIHRQRDPGIVR